MKVSAKKLLSPKAVAGKLGCSVGTLSNWRSKEIGPAFTKMPNGRVLYPEDAIDEYLNECYANRHGPNKKMIPLSELMATHQLFGINTV